MRCPTTHTLLRLGGRLAALAAVTLSLACSQAPPSPTTLDGGVDTRADLTPADGSKPPPKRHSSPFGFHPASVGPKLDFSDAQDIGVRWHRPSLYVLWFAVQPDLANPSYNFAQNDRQFKAVPKGIEILANISPDIPHRKPHDHFSGDTYLPVDEAKYIAFVKAAVERYDGDGQDDMPGLVNPVTHWQVSNEPRNDPTFADLQRITYQAIKSACPDCVVLLGGVAGFPKRYIHNFDNVYKPILSKLKGSYVDVFDFHWYGTRREYTLRDTDTREDVFAHIRTTLTSAGFAADLPLWITEMGSYSGKPPSNPIMGAFSKQSEREHARDLFKRHLYALSRGVEKVFVAFGLQEGFVPDDNYFNHTGLIYDGKDPGDLGIGIRKLAYYTYKKMTEELDGADWSTLTMLQDPTQAPHVFLAKVTKEGATRYIAWWDTFNVSGYKDGDTTTLSLDIPIGSKAIVTSVVPSSTLGKDVPTSGPSFPTKTEAIVSQKTTITLGKDPVIVKAR